MKNAETRCRHKISYLLFFDNTFNSGITKWNKNFKIKCTATKQVSYFTWSSQLCKIQRLDALRLLTTKWANSRPASSHLNLTLLILATWRKNVHTYKSHYNKIHSALGFKYIRTQSVPGFKCSRIQNALGFKYPRNELKIQIRVKKMCNDFFKIWSLDPSLVLFYTEW